LATGCHNELLTAIENDLLALFNRTFGTSLTYDPKNPNGGVSYNVNNGTVTLTVADTSPDSTGIPVNQTPSNPGTPYSHHGFKFDIRPKNGVPHSPGDYGHVIWNPGPTSGTIAGAEVHADIGTFSVHHPVDTARHGIRTIFEVLQGDPGCVQKFGDLGMF
jgi:hypothetical protein